MKQICSDCAGMGRFDDFICETCAGTGFTFTRSPERQDQLEALRPLDGSPTVGNDPNADSLLDWPTRTADWLRRNRSGNQGEGAK